MSNRKLLLADDSVTIQKVVNLTFADEGIDVMTASDGDAAMQMIESNPPDIVLADVHMPGLNGYEVCELVRANPATENIPVVLLVGSFEPFDEEQARLVGATEHLTKPFESIRGLVARVSELLESQPDVSEPDAAEAHPESEAAAAPEIQDIDNLYRDSFSDLSEHLPGKSGGQDLGDPGMDDEMIETTFLSPQHEDTQTIDEVVEIPAEIPADIAEAPAEIEYAEPLELDRSETPAEWETAPVETQPEPSQFADTLEFTNEPEPSPAQDEAVTGEPEAPAEESYFTPVETPPVVEGAESGYWNGESFEAPEHDGELSDTPAAQPEPNQSYSATAEEHTAERSETAPDINIEDSDLLDIPPADAEPLQAAGDAAAELPAHRGLSSDEIDEIATRVAANISPEMVKELVRPMVVQIVEDVTARLRSKTD